MPLGPGTRLGPYEIVAAIGAGGMGEVYKAHDTRLKRDVALKLLPFSFAADPDRLARFQREAEVLASLNHPNIAAIHGLEEGEGVRALILELVDGETLADRIARGPIPIDEALPMAKQIAEALEAAHEQGIIHRDLKPANIKLRRDGTVKVLDFGLAKLAEPGSGSRDVGSQGTRGLLSVSPTIASPALMTGVGVLLGTAAYMAPEQAKGKPADKRSDIWAFGCVLYEMLTGKRAFDGDEVSETLASILAREPDWIALPSSLAPAMRTLLGRSLAKDPKRRLHDIGDARIELEDAIRGANSGEVRGSVQHRIRWREPVAWLTAIASMAAALFFASHTRAIPSRELVRLSVLPPEKTSFSGSSSFTVNVPEFELSPNGRAIVFAAAPPGAKPTLWYRSLDSLVANSLTGTEGAEFPFWSPDSRWIGFFADGKLKKVSAVGGPVQSIVDAPDPRPGSWGPDGTIIFSTGISGILKVPSSGGRAEPVFELDAARKEGQHRYPAFLPDGTHFLFTIRSSVPDYNGVYLGSLDGTTKRLLINGSATLGGQTTARYGSGYLFFVNGDALMGQRFDQQALTLAGSPFLVEEGIGRSSAGSGAYSLSETGTLAYAGQPSESSRLVWFDRAGKPSGSVGAPGDWTDFRLSPDDSQLAASLVNTKTGVPDVWVTDLKRGSSVPFTFGPAVNAAAIWSPDGSRILFRSTRTGGLTEFYAKRTGGGGKEEPVLLQTAMREFPGVLSAQTIPSDWSPDGAYVLLSANVSSQSDLWLLRVKDAKPTTLLSAPGDQWHGNFSPDGRFIAYTSNESGRFEVYVQTFPPSDRRWPVSTGGGYEPRWRSDGREIYYLSADARLMAVPVGSDPSFGTPVQLFQTALLQSVTPQRTHYVPSRNGQRFLIATPAEEQRPIVTITVVLNATSGFKP